MVGFVSLLCHHLVIFSRVIVMFFQRLEDLRIDHDKTQQDIADILHCKREVYRRYEKGVREIPVWAVITLAQYYNCTTDYILGLSPVKSPAVPGKTSSDKKER